MYKIKQIERQLKTDFSLELVPSGEDICRVQLFSMIDAIKSTEVREEQISEYIPAIMGLFEEYSKEDLIKSFVSAEFNKFLEYYQRAGDLNANPKGDRDDRSSRRDDSRGDRNDRGGEREFSRRGDSGGGRDRDRSSSSSGGRASDVDKQRFFLNIGDAAGINKGAIVRIICNNSNIPSSEVGRIDIFKEFSFFDVTKDLAEKVLDGMRNADYNGQSMKVELSNKAGQPGSGGSDRGSNRGGERRGGSSNGGGDRGRSGGGFNRERSSGGSRPSGSYNADAGRERKRRK